MVPSPALAAHFRSLEGAAATLLADAPRTLARQLAVAAVAAPTGAEAARAEFVARSLRRAGIDDVTQDGAGNVVARLPVAGADRDAAAVHCASPVCVLAHLDTVFDADTPLAVRRDGGRLHCPGIGDNGRGLTALVAIARLLAAPAWRSAQHRPIELVATVGEEGLGNLRGARHYLDGLERRGLRPTAVVVLDGPGDAAIVRHAVASRRLRVDWRGPGGHSWCDAGAPNPVHAAGLAIAGVARLAGAGRRDRTIAVTRIGGGESLTAIPEHAWIEIDMRALEPSALESLSADVHALLRRDISATCTVSLLGERPAGSLAADHPLVRLAVQATEWQGVTPVAAMASTDANIALSRGIPAIAIGAGGRGGGAHTTGEWYDDEFGTRGVVRAFAIVTGLAHHR